MKPDQDWGDVWPTARTFHPGTVPLPVRQGYPANDKPIPDKWGNAELMKIPNFLHLTPPVVERHCAAIRSEFCNVNKNMKVHLKIFQSNLFGGDKWINRKCFLAWKQLQSASSWPVWKYLLVYYYSKLLSYYSKLLSLNILSVDMLLEVHLKIVFFLSIYYFLL